MREKMIVDIVVDLSHGDCSKGKVVHNLLKNGNYTHAIRFSGSQNAGHTIYHNDKKIITHLIPAGVFFNVRSIVGPGCVLHVKSFFEELKYLSDNGIDCYHLVKIAKNAHIITDQHIEEDSKDTKIGTTKRGVGPAYRDKYGRTGIQAKDIPELQEFLVDFYEEIFTNEDQTVAICEGAQGFYLDPNFGDYPYVTSSHCTVAGALINGIPHTAIRNVYGVSKAYDTYVGAKKFEPDGDEVLIKFREVGNEFGATTGRPRQCNYLNINALQKAIKVNAVNNLIISKMDIVKQVGVWRILHDNCIVVDLGSEEKFKQTIIDYFPQVPKIQFSYSPYEI